MIRNKKSNMTSPKIQKNSLHSPQSTPTVGQIFGAMSPNQIWASVLALATAFCAVASVAFIQGQRTSEVAVQEKLNSLSMQLSKAQTEILIQTERTQQTTASLKQYADYIVGLNAQISKRDTQLAALNEQLGRTNTCSYLQQQISSLEQQISNISSGKKFRGGGMLVFSTDTDEQRKRDEQRRAQDEAEVAQLQQRVIAYSQQLNACAK